MPVDLDGISGYERQLQRDIHDCGHEMQELMYGDVSALPAGTTLQECHAAVVEQLSRAKGLHERIIRPKQRTFFQPARKVLSDFNKIIRDSGSTEERRKNVLQQWQLRMKLGSYNEMLSSHANMLQQAAIYKLIENQTDEIKEWVLSEVLSQFSRHVQPPKKDTRPVVTVDWKQTTGTSVPPEIMSMVYSLADLESCVALRQVNSEWYSVFQQMEDVLSRKLKQRNPWMHPGDSDLQTWQDCVLVFVARLKWPTVERLTDVLVPQKIPKSAPVVGVELGLDEKLPSNFTGMQPYSSRSCMMACGHIHVGSVVTLRDFVCDLWTLKSRERCSPTELVRDEGRNSVVKNMDVEITLPTEMVPADLETLEVDVRPDSVMIKLEDGKRLIMPRDKPHFENGFTLVVDNNAKLFETNNVLYTSKPCPQTEDTFKYSFVDPETKEMIEYPSETKEYLTAFYNGLTWWHIFKKMLVPTFIDLDSPKKIYYSPSKTISVFSDEPFTQTSRSRDAHHFAVSSTFGGQGAEIVNFATGYITSVSAPMGYTDRFEVFPGFLDGTFQARVMRMDVWKKTCQRVLEENGEHF